MFIPWRDGQRFCRLLFTRGAWKGLWQMQYLEAAEYVAFGLGDDTADSVVVAASAMIDAFCRRPSLLVTQYVERMRLHGGCEAQVSYLPLGAGALIGVRARLGRPLETSPIAQALYAFGLAGQWMDVDPATVVWTPDGVVTLPRHCLGLPFKEVEVTYMAGYPDVPRPVKVACAQIVKNGQAMPALNVRRQAMDRMQMQYFAGALLDAEVQRLLQPYVAERVG